jgi:hypothetical protein
LEGYLILMVMAFTCESYMGRGEKESDGVGEDEGGSQEWPEDGDGEDEEGAGEVDQVKAGQADHQAQSINDE